MRHDLEGASRATAPSKPFVQVDSKYCWNLATSITGASIAVRGFATKTKSTKQSRSEPRRRQHGVPDLRQTAARCRVRIRGFSSCHTLMQPTLFKPIREAGSWMVKAAVTHLQERCTIANAVYGRTADALLGLKHFWRRGRRDGARNRRGSQYRRCSRRSVEMNCWECCRTAWEHPWADKDSGGCC